MKYIDEFRDKGLIAKVAERIRRAADPRRAYNFMEVCGTHTMNIFRFGLRALLPPNINLISGPGCPVCVTPNEYIDKAIAIAKDKDVVVATFGDLFRVPGSRSSLEKARAEGSAVKIVYSCTDSLDMARRNPNKEVVFLGVGFETTAPTVAASIIQARREKIGNFSVLCGHKTMPAALEALAGGSALRLDGFLLPGHVSAIIGAKVYEFLAARHRKRCVIAGFEPLDIMQALYLLVTQDAPRVEVQYSRVISPEGNRLARKILSEVFTPVSSAWRGIGEIKASGLSIRGKYKDYDAFSRFKPKVRPPRENKKCLCGAVLKGMKKPTDCKLFGKACTPSKPVGACMVSSEGTCAAYHKYGV